MLSLSVYQQLLEKFGTVDEIYLSGGEPFEHPALVAFVESAQHHARRTVLYSSGVRIGNRGIVPLSPRELAVVAMRGLHRVDLSLYSPRADEHDEITRIPGSFSALMQTVRTLRDLGIPFGIHFVPLVAEGLRVRAVASLARGIGAVRFHVLAISPQGRAKSWSADSGARFLAEVDGLRDGSTFEVLRSSAIRRAVGRGGTPRDTWNAIFIDVRGDVHRSEGDRSKLKIAERPSTLASIAIELASLS
jgi:MoaA/NifB/PqqE/SkfB family radical SAM enzyme